ncbi:putative quinone oxidoreductase [Scedosporium apiospermum]|uniref:Probable quinone oxidoreductase n=1 Tax=Pseudallescheria apiosperma TaxID=563466 RepID=A0A084G8H9_PSEDA|nr:putative quinone oxidoreductase [Scedosporium apiospermum]KEZ43641.1 putative quinone oxidoreductase [Scedosporium apiospermum]
MPIPSTQKAVVVEQVGGPEVLQYRTDYPVPTPGEGQVLVKNTLSGINFIDTYFRTGLYPSPKPEVLGRAGTGVIVALGPNSEKHDFKVGDRVVWLGNAAAPVAQMMKLPDGLSDVDAVGSYLSGLTALALTEEAYRVGPGDCVLLHAAAGSTGILMTQILKTLGAKVIGTAGGPEKVAFVKSLGAGHVIDYRSEAGKNWVDEVKRLTNQEGVGVFYDSVGKETWEGDREVAKRKGTIVWFGNASGPVPPLPLNLLSAKCLKVARPTLFGYIATREEFQHYADELFRLLLSGKLKVKVHGVYKLEEVQRAHKTLEVRAEMETF